MRRVVSSVVLSVAVVIGMASPASAVVETTLTPWQWNVSGWVIHRGSTVDGLVPAVVSSIRNRGADVVALNEICLGQYQAVQRSLDAAGWPEDPTNFARFEAHSSTACGGQPFGLAIFSQAPLGAANRYTLTSDGSTEARKLLCAPRLSQPRLRFCTTHITPRNELKVNETQLREVRTRLEAFAAAGDTVLIAGDFNAQPHYGRLDDWYSPAVNTTVNGSNTGAYRELDDTDTRCPGYGETTTATGVGQCGQTPKIDLVFVRGDRIVGTPTADSLAIPACGAVSCSDHRVVTGSVRVLTG